MNNVYQINWIRLAKALLPISLRKPVLILIIRKLFVPIEWLHSAFLAYRQECLYKAQHNSQIIYLEKVLNDAFDSTERRIRIVNAVFKQPIFFYEPLDNKDVFFYDPEDSKPVFLYSPEQFIGEGCDFYVYIPPDIEEDEEIRPALEIQISGLVEFYKLYSKNFKLIWEQLSE